MVCSRLLLTCTAHELGAALPFLLLQAPGDEPVWRQLLWHFHSHGNPEVAQRAAEGLAGLALTQRHRQLEPGGS